ncbi:hypothetical protein AURDEDRAFT_164129 [Auricularia subglabra TFB-10046 SS5]|nr:hypothetical protein AURDEDRAFT_164129 [Auricularia subglabra TFB-10046 SS5]
MPLRAVNLSRSSAALTGLSLAANIAHEATDGVPVVNQILGVVLRIVILAEKVERDREALHSLAERSQKIAQRIQDVLSSREPSEGILRSLEGVHMFARRCGIRY